MICEVMTDEGPFYIRGSVPRRIDAPFFGEALEIAFQTSAPERIHENIRYPDMSDARRLV